MQTTFRTKIKHKPGTEIEVHGQYFTFDAAGFGALTTDHPGVIDRLRAIPEGFVELASEAKQAPAAIAPQVQAQAQAPQPEQAQQPEQSEQPEQPEQAAPGNPDEQGQSDGEASQQPDAPNFVLQGPGGVKVDLGAMDDTALRAFVVEHGLKVNGRAKGDTLRKAIVAELTKG